MERGYPIWMLDFRLSVEKIKLFLQMNNKERPSPLTPEQELYQAARSNDPERMAQILTLHKGNIDVNWQNPRYSEYQKTALIVACREGRDDAVKFLLALPEVIVNKTNMSGQTAMSVACVFGRVSTVKILLKDPRVDINMPSTNGATPLWYAAHHGNLEVIQWMMATSKFLDIDRMTDPLSDMDPHTTPYETARKKGHKTVADLCLSFKNNPGFTKMKLRKELGITDALAADFFATIVLISDNYLQFKPNLNDDTLRIQRFLRIACNLPLELQMVLSNRMAESMADFVLTRDFDDALKWILFNCQKED